jgi:hypothetical protein
MQSLRRVPKVLFKLVGGIAIAAVALFVLSMGYFFYCDSRARRGAQALCGQAIRGGDAGALVARADGITVRDVAEKSRLDFVFGVPIRSAHVCRISVTDGRITAATVKYERDGRED